MAIHNRTGNASKRLAILPNYITESLKLCAICQKPYHPRNPKEWFCNSCYIMWNDEIRERKPWVKFCISSELSRRRQENRVSKALYLGGSWDIDDSGTLVRIRSEHG